MKITKFTIARGLINNKALLVEALDVFDKWKPAIQPILYDHQVKHPWCHNFVTEITIFCNDSSNNPEFLLDEDGQEIFIEYSNDDCIITLYANEYMLEMKFTPSEVHLHQAAAA